jgi:hypothetical protein
LLQQFFPNILPKISARESEEASKSDKQFAFPEHWKAEHPADELADIAMKYVKGDVSDEESAELIKAIAVDAADLAAQQTAEITDKLAMDLANFKEEILKILSPGSARKPLQEPTSVPHAPASVTEGVVLQVSAPPAPGTPRVPASAALEPELTAHKAPEPANRPSTSRSSSRRSKTPEREESSKVIGRSKTRKLKKPRTNEAQLCRVPSQTKKQWQRYPYPCAEASPVTIPPSTFCDQMREPLARGTLKFRDHECRHEYNANPCACTQPPPTSVREVTHAHSPLRHRQ